METKLCPKCGVEKVYTSEFFPYRSKKAGTLCTPCKECKNQSNKDRLLEHRLIALTHYSSGIPSCSCCGEQRVEFLAMDHINGGGHQHRKTGGAINIATWLINHEFPEGFRVLCHNCNLSLGFYGYCPHKTAGGWFTREIEKEYASSSLYCKHGHKMFGDSLVWTGKTRVRRTCNPCKNAANKRRRAKRVSSLLHSKK